MAASKKLNSEVLERLENELEDSLSRHALVEEVHNAHYVPLGAAWDYAERLAEVRGLSY